MESISSAKLLYLSLLSPSSSANRRGEISWVLSMAFGGVVLGCGDGGCGGGIGTLLTNSSSSFLHQLIVEIDWLVSQ